MKKLTLRIPDVLMRELEAEARRRGLSKSVLVRECVEGMLRRQKRRSYPSCLDLVADLAGSQPGPRDASVKRSYLAEVGWEPHRKKRPSLYERAKDLCGTVRASEDLSHKNSEQV